MSNTATLTDSAEGLLVNRQHIPIDLDAGTVDVEFDSKVIQRSAIERAIESAGFDVPAQ